MSLSLALTLVCCFVSVALLSGAATSSLLTSYSPERRRLRRLAASAAFGTPSGVLVEREDPRLLALTGLLPGSPARLERLRRRLEAAGRGTPSAMAAYSAATILAPSVLGLAVLLVVGLGRWSFVAAAAALAGYFVPGLFLSRAIERRKLEIRNGLPDALDLLTVCVEAGSGLDQALVKVTDELRLTAPSLAEELRIVAAEIRAGKPRIDAFRALADRTAVEEVRAFVGLLTQTDRFGTSIGQALRTHASALRTRRRQRAEERAAKVGAKLAFPLVLLLFPALYIVVLGPAAIQFLRVFKPLIK